MPKQPQQIPILQSRGRSGGGAASLSQIAIAGFIDDQNKAQKAMMKNFSQLQEAQAADAAQSSAQMTGAMNQVVRREDERVAREESMQEKTKDREYQERYHEFTAKFQEQATKDFAATQSRVNSQLAAGADFVQRMDTDRVEFGDHIRGMRQSLQDPDYIEKLKRTPGGIEWLEGATRKLRVAELYHERDHQSTYAGEVKRMMIKVQEQIAAGEPHADLTKLLTTETQDVLRGDLNLPSDTHDWSNDELEELYHSGGYPPGGLYGRDPDDESLQKYRDFSPVEYMSTLRMMEDEEAFSIIQHDQGRQDWAAMRLESEEDTRGALNKLATVSTQDYDMLASTVVDRSYFGVAGFLDELGSGKTSIASLSESRILKSGGFGAQDIQHTMAAKMLESMFVSIAGPGSEPVLKALDNLLSGEGDEGILDTEVELFKGFHIRNVLRHIDDQVLAMSRAAIKGDPAAAKFAKQIFESPPTLFKGELVRGLTMVPGDVARGERLEKTRFNRFTGQLAPEVELQLEDGINRMFLLVRQMAMELRDVVEGQPSLQSYHMKQGRSARSVDAYVASYMSHNPDADPVGVRQEARLTVRQEGEKLGLAEIDRGPPEGFDLEAATLKAGIKLSPLQAAVELYEAHSSQTGFLAALFSGDYDLAPVDIPPVSQGNLGDAQLGLDRYVGASKSRRLAVKAEMRRRRERYAKTHPQPGEVDEQKPPVE